MVLAACCYGSNIRPVEKSFPPEARCLRCGYRLFALPDQVCPECGRRFSPDDSSTFTLPGQWRWPHIPEPPPGWHLAIALPLTIAYIWWSSVPGGLYASLSSRICLFLPVAFGAFAILVFEYIARAYAIWHERRVMPEGKAPGYKPVRRWLGVPLCGLVILSAMFSSWPLRARFNFAQAHFENALNLYRAGAAPQSLLGKCGLFDVIYIHPFSDGRLFFQTGDSGLDKVGILYSPVDRPRRRRETRLAPNWYTDMW